MKKIILTGLLVFGVFSSTYAATENGIVITETLENVGGSALTSNLGQVYVKEAARFSAHNISDAVGTNTYIYNDTNGTSSTAGSVNTKGILSLNEMLTVDAIAGGTITAKIEVGVGANSTWYEALTITFTAIGTNYVSIAEKADRVRVGWKKSATGTATVSNTSSYKGNTK